MTVTIHANPPSDLYQLIRDLQTLDGSGNPYRVRRAIHGSGAIVEDDLALAWLMVTRAGQPEYLESLIRTSTELEDLVGRRASDAALQELHRYLGTAVADNEVILEPGEVVIPLSAASETRDALERKLIEAQEVPESPARKASKSDWEQWAIKAGLGSPEQVAAMTKAQLQELDGQPTKAAPEEVKEG